MGLVEDIKRVGALLDRYYSRVTGTGDGFALVCISTEEALFPEMQTGKVDAFGQAVWQPMNSTARAEDLYALEREVGAQFPPLFRAYALSRCHFLQELHGGSFRFLLPIFAPEAPLENLKRHADPAFVTLGLLPFGSFEDAYGPLCFDLECRMPNGDCPVVWIDHEFMSGLESHEWNRARVEPEIQRLYPSFRAMLEDLFGPV